MTGLQPYFVYACLANLIITAVYLYREIRKGSVQSLEDSIGFFTTTFIVIWIVAVVILVMSALVTIAWQALGKIPI